MSESAVQRLPTEERQAVIVSAALTLARDLSPAAITTTDIAAVVGVSQGALFKHFPTKEAIWLGVMDWVQQQLMARLAQAAEAAPTPLAALEAVFHAHVDFVAAHPGVPRLVFHELQQPAESKAKQAVRAMLAAYRKLLLGLLGQAVRTGELPAGLDREAAATLFVGVVQGLVMQSMMSGKPAAMRGQAASLFSLLYSGLRNPA